MSQYVLLSDKPPESHEQFIMEALEYMGDKPVVGVALVALLEDGTSVTGYHELDVLGKQIAAAQIQADITDDLVRANIADFLAEMEGDEACEEE